ncbi:MAG: hypothetical protein QMC77_08090 [Methanocellales archaeon]|nr:hypothetical protein [Methanocellales archaeon]MDI6903679.1 hypothetical protein [Methanocellales archaeon]
MANITLAIPEELHRIVKRHSEVKWSEIARRAMWDYARRLELMDKIVAKSKLTEEDVKELDHKLKKAIFEHYRELIG